jgi:endonuclease YncB( thermonuclease family)
VPFYSRSRLGADEAKRRETLRQLEAEAQAAEKGVWAPTGESVGDRPNLQKAVN